MGSAQSRDEPPVSLVQTLIPAAVRSGLVEARIVKGALALCAQSRPKTPGRPKELLEHWVECEQEDDDPSPRRRVELQEISSQADAQVQRHSALFCDASKDRGATEDADTVDDESLGWQGMVVLSGDISRNISFTRSFNDRFSGSFSQGHTGDARAQRQVDKWELRRALRRQRKRFSLNVRVPKATSPSKPKSSSAEGREGGVREAWCGGPAHQQGSFRRRAASMAGPVGRASVGGAHHQRRSSSPAGRSWRASWTRSPEYTPVQGACAELPRCASAHACSAVLETAVEAPTGLAGEPLFRRLDEDLPRPPPGRRGRPPVNEAVDPAPIIPSQEGGVVGGGRGGRRVVTVGRKGRQWVVAVDAEASWDSFVGVASEAVGADLAGLRLLHRDRLGKVTEGGWGGAGGEVLVLEGEGEGLMPPSRLSPDRPMHYRLGKMLGKGAYGAVHEALLESGASVAVKRVDLGRCARGTGKDSRLSFGAESDVLRNLPPHPHVVAFLASETPPTEEGEALIWMECVSGGSVSGMLRTYGALREDTAARFAAHAVSGLAFLHGRGVVHRDVKPANLLVTVCGTVKLGDFGSALVLGRGGGRARGIAGTPNYMAPEMLRMVAPGGDGGGGDGTYDCRADVWSLGMTLLEMLTAEAPYSELSNPFAVMFHIARHPSPPLPPNASSRALAFLARCLERCPEARAGSEELCADPFLPFVFGVEPCEARPGPKGAPPCHACERRRRSSLGAVWRGGHPAPQAAALALSRPPTAALQEALPLHVRGVHFGRTPSA